MTRIPPLHNDSFDNQLPADIMALFEQMTTGVLLVSAPVSISTKPLILYANPALCTIIQMRLKDILNRPLHDFLGYISKRAATGKRMPDGQIIPIVMDNDWGLKFGEPPLFGDANPIPIKTKDCQISLSGWSGRMILIESDCKEAALSQSHQDFISTVSHEFRTPLTSIKGFADTMLQYGEKLEASQQRRFLHIIKEQSDRLIRLVENLLTVSKSGANSLDVSFRPVNLSRLLERITQSVAIKSTVPHPFIVDIPNGLSEVWAEPDRLEQVLTNLIDNAVKYSYPDKPITIKASERQQPGQAETLIVIEVIDEGMGIPNEHLEKLFTKFYRIESPLTQKVEGTGLGLYIAQSLTRSMGGELSVKSIEEEGSIFSFSLPVATLERQASYQRKRHSFFATEPGAVIQPLQQPEAE